MSDDSSGTEKKASVLKSFPGQFWLVIIFEFFERGSYYGMMSVLAVYLTDILGFSKEGVGIIAGTIQPILYFFPIISGALADRFGYRKMLTLAFGLMGTGYFITSQMTGYTTVFLSLCLMAIGAGTFKPIISGSIARMTNEDNSTLGFGIFYWTINLGAFLFPLILVPFLKNNIGWNWVIIASALGTGAMLLPTIFFFKEPPRHESAPRKEFNLIRTIANAFEIIYSPFILMFHTLKSSKNKAIIIYFLIAIFAGLALWNYLSTPLVEEKFAGHIENFGEMQIVVNVDRNMMQDKNYSIKNQVTTRVEPFKLTIEVQPRGERHEFFSPIQPMARDINLTLYSSNLDSIYGLLSSQLNSYVKVSQGRLDSLLHQMESKTNNRILLTIYKPEKFENFKLELLQELNSYAKINNCDEATLQRWIAQAEQPKTLQVKVAPNAQARTSFDVSAISENDFELHLLIPEEYESAKSTILGKLRDISALSMLTQTQLDGLVAATSNRSFLYLFIILLLITSLIILAIQPRFNMASKIQKFLWVLLFCVIIGATIWLIPGLGNYGRIISTVIYATVLSLFLIDFQDIPKFKDHFRFVLMIFIYSGFWILYFQMFGSVLWYVQAYVDASSLNVFVNRLLGYLGLNINWFFDVEHVTVINAGTIILLQLIISNIVKNTKALWTMIAGILMGTIGMAILAISTGIWVFIIGIIIFSVGEMTAHPKFISYVGQTAPRDRVATYMGYIFLYGVIGSSIGSVLGANLYVQFVDKLHQPKTLWMIFSGIGVVTIICLLIYNKFFAVDNPREESSRNNS